MKKIILLKKVAALMLITAVVCSFSIIASAADENVFDVTEFNAVADDELDDGAAIQDAFDACNEAGGGTIYFPMGTYCVSKTVFYYSNQKIVFEDGSVLKRITNNENSSDTCGVLLCNWFETADTNSETSAVACENVEIDGGIFDGGGIVPEDNPIGVAMINTCHASDIVIKNCKFINNYTAHCIEINSSENVYIENCSFSDYIGTNDTVRYNEMIQIDKSVNAALGSYIDSDFRVIRGYYNETKIDELNPDCKGSSNINIYGCTFDGNELCSAIGNHHSSSYKTVNSDIKIYDNIFTGGASERGYISFDNHTRNIEIYNNTFENSLCGITVNRTDANCTVHDNTFVNCSTAYKGSYSAYMNDIDGTIDSVDKNNPITDEKDSENNNSSQNNSFFAQIMNFFNMLIEMIKSLFGL